MTARTKVMGLSVCLLLSTLAPASLLGPRQAESNYAVRPRGIQAVDHSNGVNLARDPTLQDDSALYKASQVQEIENNDKRSTDGSAVGAESDLQQTGIEQRALPHDPEAVQPDTDKFPPLSVGQLQSVIHDRCTSSPGPIRNTPIQMNGALALNDVLEIGSGLERTIGRVQLSLDARPLKSKGYIIVQGRERTGLYGNGVFISYFTTPQHQGVRATPSRQWKVVLGPGGDQIDCFLIAPLGSGYWYLNVES